MQRRALVASFSLAALTACGTTTSEEPVVERDVDAVSSVSSAISHSIDPACLTATAKTTLDVSGATNTVLWPRSAPRSVCDYHILELTNPVGEDLEVVAHEGLDGMLSQTPLIVLPQHCVESGFHGQIYGFIPAHSEGGVLVPAVWHELADVTQSGVWSSARNECDIGPTRIVPACEHTFSPSIYTKIRVFTKTWYVDPGYVTRRGPSWVHVHTLF